MHYGELLEKAGQVSLVNHAATWHDWERYSARQERKMKLGGIMGELTYGPGWADFFWLLALGEVVHAGKGATFGLGRYRMSYSAYDRFV